jgi:hypothetical protein
MVKELIKAGSTGRLNQIKESLLKPTRSGVPKEELHRQDLEIIEIIENNEK